MLKLMEFMLMVVLVRTLCCQQMRKKKIFEIVKDEAKDDVKLIAQVGSINLKRKC